MKTFSYFVLDDYGVGRLHTITAKSIINAYFELKEIWKYSGAYVKYSSLKVKGV